MLGSKEACHPDFQQVYEGWVHEFIFVGDVEHDQPLTYQGRFELLLHLVAMMLFHDD